MQIHSCSTLYSIAQTHVLYLRLVVLLASLVLLLMVLIMVLLLMLFVLLRVHERRRRRARATDDLDRFSLESRVGEKLRELVVVSKSESLEVVGNHE